MNKLLVRVYLFLLIMVAIALVHVGSIQTQIMTTGEFWGYQVIEKNELHIFYQNLNELLRTRFITEYKDSNSIMNSTIDELEDTYELGVTLKLLGVYDENLNWVAGSDNTLKPSDDVFLASPSLQSYLRFILPPKKIEEIWHIGGVTTDGRKVTFICQTDDNARRILNNYSVKTYKLNMWSIITAILIAFLPIGIFFYVNYIRPLDRLESAANAIARGQLDFNIESRGLDEIKDFSKAFENMRFELEESKKREQEILENRQQLITNISHDLRTPITSISGYVEGLIDGKGENPERMDRYLKTIKSKTAYLNSMINDLFQFSQMDMGDYSLELKTWNSRELCNALLEPVELWLESESFEIDIKRPFPIVPIRVDYSRLSQVVENIVQNSLKYTEDNGKLVIEGQIIDHNFVISFSDNGIGIADNALPFIFEAFFREDKSRTQSLGGSGLGLSICKKIIELHGGQIYVSSTVGQGTKLDVYLPLEPLTPLYKTHKI